MASIYTINSSKWITFSPRHQHLLPKWLHLASFVVIAAAVVVQSLSHVFAAPWTAARQASLSFTISWSLLRLTSIESMMPSNHLILCCPLLVLPSIFPSIRVSFSESALQISSIRASVSASVLPMSIQGWFPLGLTGLISCYPRDSQESSPAPQFESISSSVLSRLYGPALASVHDHWESSAVFTAQLSHLYTPTGKARPFLRPSSRTCTRPLGNHSCD